MSGNLNLQILALLKNNPRGLSIKEVSELIHVNRNTVSGALNVLQVSGQVEVREIGPARVYYLSNKVPISSILNISDDCIAVVNSNGNIVQINDSCIEIIGLSRAELLDKPYENLFSSFSFDSKQMIVENITEGLKGVESRFEISVKWDLETAYFSIKVIPTVFLNGESGVIIFGVDISESKRLVDELAKSETRFRKLFEHSHDLITFIDDNARTLWANPAWVRIFGDPSNTKADPFDLIHPDDLEDIRSEWESLVSGGSSNISLVYRYDVPERGYVTFDTNVIDLGIEGEETFCVIAHPRSRDS